MSAMEVSTPEAGDLVEVGKLEIGGVIDGDAPVTSLNFHANGEYLVSASRDGKCAQPVMQRYKRILRPFTCLLRLHRKTRSLL
jgi:hypothetical protein